jgi:hypothetical protein
MEEEQYPPKFRILASDLSKGEAMYSINEVIYDDFGNLIGFHRRPITLTDFCEGKILDDLTDALDAYEHPILSAENFPNKYEDI